MSEKDQNTIEAIGQVNEQTERVKRTKIHGYKKHIVSEFLKDRHPYLEPPFKLREDPTEVFHAVFDRQIPKLVDILSYTDLPSQNYREAFMLLNEMSSHQENKDIMISFCMVQTSLNYMKHEDEEVRREATLLLGSLISVKRTRDCLIEPHWEIEPALIDSAISDILIKDTLACREACGWMLCRMTSGRDGVDLLVDRHTEILKNLIISFKSNCKKRVVEEAQFLIYLLETMSNLMITDEGIENFVGFLIMREFNNILKDEPFSPLNLDEKIRTLCLRCIALMTVNPIGKEEAIQEKVIDMADNYLLKSNEDMVNSAVRTIMFGSIHLNGKVQAINKDQGGIIRNLIALLESPNKDIVENVRHALVVIADLPRGYSIVVKYLSAHLEHLKSIFGPTSIIPLYGLLFKVNKPPFLTKENIELYKRAAFCIAHFINNEKHEKEALQYSIEKNFRNRLPKL